jgi:uncharacterized protein (TIGR02452 family)
MSRLNRLQRASAARQTLSILSDGHYTTADGDNVDISARIAASKAGSVAYRTEMQFDALLASARSSSKAESSTEVTRETTLAACKRLSAEPGAKVAALNFASAKNVCGGMLGGSLAQEESIGEWNERVSHYIAMHYTLIFLSRAPLGVLNWYNASLQM